MVQAMIGHPRLAASSEMSATLAPGTGIEPWLTHLKTSEPCLISFWLTVNTSAFLEPDVSWLHRIVRLLRLDEMTI